METLPLQSDDGRPYIAIDTREQHPYIFRPNKRLAGTVDVKLDYGDYQIYNRPDLIAIERKNSVTEIAGNLGKHRNRFVKELERMQSCKYRYVIIEDYFSSIFRHGYSQMKPAQIIGSITTFWIRYNTPFIFAGSRSYAQNLTRDLLIKAYEEDQRNV
jgi:hypothetical protein